MMYCGYRGKPVRYHKNVQALKMFTFGVKMNHKGKKGQILRREECDVTLMSARLRRDVMRVEIREQRKRRLFGRAKLVRFFAI